MRWYIGTLWAWAFIFKLDDFWSSDTWEILRKSYQGWKQMRAIYRWIIEAYKNWYYEDKIITKSKSKEKYRLKLKQKEQMLKENGSGILYGIKEIATGRAHSVLLKENGTVLSLGYNGYYASITSLIYP